MTVAFYMNCVSSHQLPLAKEIAKAVDGFTYVYETASDQVYQQAEYEGATTDKSCLETDDIVYTGLRDLDLFERRAKKCLTTFYTSERWFKPIPLRVMKLEKLVGVGDWNLPGSLRLLLPNYRRMVKRFVKWANEDPNARVLAIGPHAKRDFLRMGVRADKIVDWGYFVEPSVSRVERVERVEKTLRVLWAGRDIPLKHVSDIDRAVVLANKNLTSALHLHLDSTPILFTKLTGVSPDEVREAMRSHDTLVFASNGFEGWGAVVSEALEEGMNAIGTYECGAPPTLLPKERLYHCGDVSALAKLLEAEYRGELPPCTIGDWTAAKAAERFLSLQNRSAYEL